uniref:Uncharacterized protein n=1 Tax=Arundo donax TaxID=35708 RepID=A0A0A9EP90_ARUDO
MECAANIRDLFGRTFTGFGFTSFTQTNTL